jgi:putative CocE/NonD family hydrolase
MPEWRFLAQDTRWALELAKRKLQKRLLLPRASIASGTPDRFDEISVGTDVEIPMRDGTLLRGDLYRPKSGDRFPAILTRMPYGKGEYYCYMPAIGRFWARKGYAYLAQDVRGKWSSEGEWDPFINEAHDGYDTIDWVAGQPWCDGNIGMVGESYYGYTCWAAATTGHPNLKCIAPSTTAMDIQGTWIFNGGAFCLQTMGTWAIEMNATEYNNPLRLDYGHLPLLSMDDDAGTPCPYYRDWLRHPTRDSYWSAINLHEQYARIKIPALHFSGWYDVFLKATFEDWQGIRDHSDDASTRQNQWLVIGPWDHEYTTDDTHRIGRLDIGDASATTHWDQCQAFFDYWLRGADNGFHRTPRVQLFTIGDDIWHSGSEWPPEGITYHNYYFHSMGNAHQAGSDASLSLTAPISEEPADAYTYDPLDPVALTLGIDLWSRAQVLQDRAQLPERPDVLVYQSGPLAEDLQITGPITVTLYASSSAVDTDFTAALVDIFPGGYAHLIQEGITRSAYRFSDRETTPGEPGRVHEYDIDLWATSFVVKAGHRLRVEISSSNFNRYDRNPNTGEPFGTAIHPVSADQRVFHTAQYPSHITLPIIPR